MGIPAMKAGLNVDCVKIGGRGVVVPLVSLYATIARQAPVLTTCVLLPFQ
ncbi:hypothetical protein AVEN_1985-1, partial [Araneus ventricosus]